MEISKVNETSTKIKGKSASLIIDPTSKVDAEIVLATQPLESLALDKVEGSRLIISGPGEYEAGGISVSGKATKTGTQYVIFDNAKILLVNSSELSDVPDDEEYDAVLVKVTSPFSDDALGPIHAKCSVLYGDTGLFTTTSDMVETISKVNLKKTAEIQGKIFILG